MNGELARDLIITLGGVIGAWFVYKGAIRTARTAKEANEGETKADAQQSALDAWQHLLDPYIKEVDQLRKQMGRERTERGEHERATRIELDKQQREIAQLRADLATWQRVAKTIARWATSLRDEVLRLGGTVPATPDELLTLQALDDAGDPKEDR